MNHKTYITFGQNHVRRVNNITFDCDCVAVIKSNNASEGRALAFKYFGSEWCFEYPEKYWKAQMEFFPRGYKYVN